jgi:hypothetical protein
VLTISNASYPGHAQICRFREFAMTRASIGTSLQHRETEILRGCTSRNLTSAWPSARILDSAKQVEKTSRAEGDDECTITRKEAPPKTRAMRHELWKCNICLMMLASPKNIIVLAISRTYGAWVEKLCGSSLRMIPASSRSGRARKKTHTTYCIPESAARRIHTRLLNTA